MGSLALPDLLRPLRLPLVQLLADHDIRNHAAGLRIPILQPVLHRRQDVLFHRAIGVVRNHRCQPVGECFHAFLLPLRPQPVEFLTISRIRRSEEKPEGAGAVCGEGEGGAR